MKLVAVMLVKNEVDIIRDTLDWNLSQGVDLAIVTDNGSTDGTLNAIGDYVRRGSVHLIQNSGSYDQSQLTTEMALIARKEFAADWIVPIDADEMWMSETGNLKDELIGSQGNVVSVPTTNFVPTVHDDVNIASPVVRMRYKVAKPPSIPKIPQLLKHAQSKVMVRAADLVKIDFGNHGAQMHNRVRTRAKAAAVLHYPVRTREQFIQKVVTGARALAGVPSLDQSIGYHWRRWYAAYERGEMDREWKRVRLGHTLITMLGYAGVVKYDDQPARTLLGIRTTGSGK